MSKNIELYKKTEQILFNAYFNGTLQHANCAACAVGNIIANNMGIKIIPDTSFGLSWEGYNPDEISAWARLLTFDKWSNTAVKMIESTGYTQNELTRIEYAFEGVRYKNWYKPNNIEDNMFNGLVAVLDVLKGIHELDSVEPEKERFKNHYLTLQPA